MRSRPRTTDGVVHVLQSYATGGGQVYFDEIDQDQRARTWCDWRVGWKSVVMTDEAPTCLWCVSERRFR